MDWLGLALIAAFVMASADAATKAFYPDKSGVEVLVLRLGTSGLLLLPVAVLNPIPPVPAIFWGLMGILVPLELVAHLLYFRAIRDSALHLTLPYLAFTPVFNVLTGYLVLGETVSLAGLGGVLLVVVGAYLLNLHHVLDGQGWLAPFKAMRRDPGPRRMLVVAALFSLTSPLSKAAMGYATPWTFGPFYYSVIGLTLLLGVALWRPRTLMVLAHQPARYGLVAVLTSAMIITHFLAIARVEVAYFIAVKRTSLLFGILYGALLFKEERLGRNLLAGGFMVAGVAAIVLGG